MVAVRAGERVAFDVDARDRAYRWDVRRVGGRKVEEGRAAAGKRTLVLRSPRGASGVYLLQVRSGSSRTRVPFLVQSRERSKLLVVVPTASWLGVDKIDDDRDGLPNTLENGGPVEWPRAYTRLPPALAADTAPLLIFLDRAGIKYDLTSDIALARSDEPTAANRPGVILAGSLRWIPRSLARRLRRYVESGGRVASFGTESMRRGMRITDDVLSRPTQATPHRPVRRAARAGRGPAHRGRRPHAAAADRAHGGLLARPPDRLRRHAERVRPAGGVGQAARHARTRSCSPRSARTSPTASARRPRPRASCRARRSRCSPPRGSARGSRSASA